MREIKFRAWQEDKVGGKMYYKIYWIDWEQGKIKDALAGDFNMEGDNLWDPIWMQYTGLLDKNGKEIYEGDIITDGEIIGEIYFHDLIGYSDKPGELAYVIGDKNKPTIYAKLGLGYVGMWEIIGNVYEHPELIKR